MKVALATLCLNEMEWLPKLYEQHKDWPGLVNWTFVEGADIQYARTNPNMVLAGLSTDGTTSFLQEIASKDKRITYIPYGYFGFAGAKDQGKCEARTEYLREIDKYTPDVLVVLDADEFYTHQDQNTLSKLLDITGIQYSRRMAFRGSAYCFNQRHMWLPPIVQENPEKLKQYALWTHEVKGGYWEIVHCRVWKWEPGLVYKQNHNWPEDTKGTLLVNKIERMMRNDRRVPMSLRKMVEQGTPVPQCIHMGYASSYLMRYAKHQYYVDRGEGQEPDRELRLRRGMYVECRNAWRAWEPSSNLPYGAKVVPYTGPIPEVFRSLYI